MTNAQKKLSTTVSATISELKLLRSSFLRRGAERTTRGRLMSFFSNFGERAVASSGIQSKLRGTRWERGALRARISFECLACCEARRSPFMAKEMGVLISRVKALFVPAQIISGGSAVSKQHTSLSQTLKAIEPLS